MSIKTHRDRNGQLLEIGELMLWLTRRETTVSFMLGDMPARVDLSLDLLGEGDVEAEYPFKIEDEAKLMHEVRWRLRALQKIYVSKKKHEAFLAALEKEKTEKLKALALKLYNVSAGTAWKSWDGLLAIGVTTSTMNKWIRIAEAALEEKD